MRAADMRRSQVALHLRLSRSEDNWTAASQTVVCQTGMSHNGAIDVLPHILHLVYVLPTFVLITAGR